MKRCCEPPPPPPRQEPIDDECMFLMFACEHIYRNGRILLRNGRAIEVSTREAKRLIKRRATLLKEAEMRTKLVKDLIAKGWKNECEVRRMKKNFEWQIENLTFERTLDRAFRIFMGIVIGVLVYLLIQHW